MAVTGHFSGNMVNDLTAAFEGHKIRNAFGKPHDINIPAKKKSNI